MAQTIDVTGLSPAVVAGLEALVASLRPTPISADAPPVEPETLPPAEWQARFETALATELKARGLSLDGAEPPVERLRMLPPETAARSVAVNVWLRATGPAAAEPFRPLSPAEQQQWLDEMYARNAHRTAFVLDDSRNAIYEDDE